MKAEELMIGDWVMPLKKKLKGIPGKVITIDGGTGVCWIDSKDYSCLVPCSDVERIPITPEILEKNGFKDVSTHTLKGYDTYELSFGRDNDQKIIYKLDDYFAYESYDDRWYRLFETQICHRWCVHNLQHALRLCGIDKEIVV